VILIATAAILFFALPTFFLMLGIVSLSTASWSQTMQAKVQRSQPLSSQSHSSRSHASRTSLRRLSGLLFLLALGGAAVSAAGQTYDGPAELPRVTVPSAVADTPAPGAVLSVSAGGNLQSALNNAACGDTL